MRLLLPLSALALIGCAATVSAETQADRVQPDEAKLAKALKGRVPAGEPQSCINMRDIRSQKIVGKSTIIYEVSGNLAYRQDFGGSCVNLNDRDTLITRTPSTRLCRGDIANQADLVAGFETGGCIYGDFIPYRKKG